MPRWITIALSSLFCVASAQASLNLVARYDWKDGAKDVSGAPIPHDGTLENGVSTANGKLILDGWEGVKIGHVPELDSATQVLLRFEDVTFATDENQRWIYAFAVLAGDGEKWWVGAFSETYMDRRKTSLCFKNAADFMALEIWDQPISHFDSIDYWMDANAPLSTRYGVRLNNGPWVYGALVGSDQGSPLPAISDFRLNDGIGADWDPISATCGPVSLSSNIAIPEPALLGPASLLLLGLRRRAVLSKKPSQNLFGSSRSRLY